MPLWDDIDAAQEPAVPPDMWGGGGRGLTRLTVYARPQPEMRAYEPSYGERLKGGLSDIFNWLGADRYNAGKLADIFKTGAEIFPPTGIPLAVNEMQRGVEAREPLDVGLAALGAIPGVKGGKALFTKAGDPIKSAAYTKQSRNILDTIEEGPKGAGPMNLTGDLRSDVPQVAMERFQPPRGVSPRLQEALANPDVQRGVSESIERGIGMGADKWYHNEPIRREFIRELGPVQGAKDYSSYMDMVAATSPRSDVPTNIRNASFYYSKGGDRLPKKLPYPYGHVAQNLHRQNYATLSAPRASELSAGAASTGWDIFKNPKPASFSQNLQGNLEPGTMDTHAFRNIGMRTGDPRFLETSVSAKYKQGSDPGKDTIVSRYGERDGDTVTFRPQQLYESGKLKLKDALKIPYFWAAKPNPNEYAAAEKFYRNLGRDFNIPTADAQAAAWSGGGKLTGLGTVATHTFPQLMNERILYTALMRGQNPQKTLADFIKRKAPLLSIGAGGAVLAPGLSRTNEEQ